MKKCRTCRVIKYEYEFAKTPTGKLKITCIECRASGKANYRKKVKNSFFANLEKLRR